MQILLAPLAVVEAASYPRKTLLLPVASEVPDWKPRSVAFENVFEVTPRPAETPTAVLLLPLGRRSELPPIPTLLAPEVIPATAESPIAVLLLPLWLLPSAFRPNALLLLAVVRFERAPDPNALLREPT